MKLRQPFAAGIAACLLALLAACASMPPPVVQRNGTPGASAAAVAPATTTADGGIVNGAEPLPDDVGPRAVIHRGTGRTINSEAASAPPPGFAASTGEASFNFEGSPIQAVVKGILGDMLGQNFTIAPS